MTPLTLVIASMDTWNGLGNVPIDVVREWVKDLAAIRREALLTRMAATLAQMHGHDCPADCAIRALLAEYEAGKR